jgi:hypothetical protein
MNALEYIRAKGLEYKMQAGQIVLRECPFCGDHKGHLYIDQDEGLFKCHKCNEIGNLITLQKHFGDYERKSVNQTSGTPQGGVRKAFEDKAKAYHVPDEKMAIAAHERLINDEEALRYITETRGISLETVKVFKVGLQIDKSGGRWLCIPHYEKGKLINIKFRALFPTDKRFKRVTACRSILFNSDTIDGQELFICEGEIDTLTLIDQGIKNVVGLTCGAGTFEPEWIDQLQAVKKIYLVYDPDEAGQKGAREAARRLGYDRCFNVILPDGLDVNEYFLAGRDVFDFQGIVGQARQFDVAGIMSFNDGLNQLRKEVETPDQPTGIKTGFPDVDRILKTGINPGELLVLSALPKIGKSTWALQSATWNALQDNPALFFCLEMRPVKIIRKVVQCYSQKAEIGQTEIENVRLHFKGKPFYLGYCFKEPTLHGIIETLKAAIKRYGLKLIVFDHLHFLCRSINNQVQEIGQAVQAFKFLAEEFEIPVILIAQPRKIQEDKIMTAMDLKDSSSIYSDCDHLIILHRARKKGSNGELVNEAFKPETLVRVEASRYNSGGECLLYYHGDYSRFDSMTKEKF